MALFDKTEDKKQNSKAAAYHDNETEMQGTSLSPPTLQLKADGDEDTPTTGVLGWIKNNPKKAVAIGVGTVATAIGLYFYFTKEPDAASQLETGQDLLDAAQDALDSVDPSEIANAGPGVLESFGIDTVEKTVGTMVDAAAGSGIASTTIRAMKTIQDGVTDTGEAVERILGNGHEAQVTP